MRLPRDWSGQNLIKRLKRLGYQPTRQVGSHVRLTHHSASGDHHITIPLHKPLRVGTLNAILNDVATHLELSKDELIQKLR